MTTGRYRWRGALAAMAAAVAAAAPAAAQADPAAAQVEGYTEALVGVMKQAKALGVTGRRDRFLPIVKQYFDLPRMTAMAVGPDWSAISAADRASLVEAFTRHSAAQHAVNFDGYSGERFVVDPKVDARGPDRLVRVSIVAGRDTTRLGYRMRQSGSAWKIVDVYAEGVSQLAVQRADYAATLKAGGAPALVKKLDQLAARSLGGR